MHLDDRPTGRSLRPARPSLTVASPERQNGAIDGVRLNADGETHRSEIARQGRDPEIALRMQNLRDPPLRHSEPVGDLLLCHAAHRGSLVEEDDHLVLRTGCGELTVDGAKLGRSAPSSANQVICHDRSPPFVWLQPRPYHGEKSEALTSRNDVPAVQSQEQAARLADPRRSTHLPRHSADPSARHLSRIGSAARADDDIHSRELADRQRQEGEAECSALHDRHGFRAVSHTDVPAVSPAAPRCGVAPAARPPTRTRGSRSRPDSPSSPARRQAGEASTDCTPHTLTGRFVLFKSVPITVRFCTLKGV